MNNTILIIGKSKIALRHYSVLKKKNSKFFFYFQDKYNRIWTLKKNKFTIYKKNLVQNNFFFVLICTPSNTHISYLKKYIHRSRSIFLEKPFSNNLISIKNFINQLPRGLIIPKIFIGYNLRYSNALKKFKEKIDKNKYGKLLYINCQVGRSLDQWRNKNLKLAASNKNKGGGVILELSHELDYLNWIFGPIKHVFSKVNNVKKFNIGVEESYFAIFKLYNKSLINLSVDMVRCDEKRFCEAIYENATIRLDLIKGTVQIIKRKILYTYKFNRDLDNSYKNMWYKYLKNNQVDQTKCTIKNSLEILGLIDTIKKIK